MYIQWFESVLARRQRYEPWRFVLISQLLSWTSYLVLCIYLVFSGEVDGTWLYVYALGLNGMILVGLSYLLSSICYLWERIETKILHRSYVGRTGYFFLIAYSTLVLFGRPDTNPFPQYFFQEEQFFTTMLAGLALLLLTLVMLVSYGQSPYQMGTTHQRRVVRLGYVAIGLGVWLLTRVSWSNWVGWFGFVPPASLLIWIFLIWVLVMRLVLAYRLRM